MKRILLLLITLSSWLILFAQQDRFTNFEEMVGKNIVIYNPREINQGVITYYKNNGKLKHLDKKYDGNTIENEILYVISIDTIQNKRFLHVKSKHTHEIEYFLHIKSLQGGISNIRNVTYYQRLFGFLTNHYLYTGSLECETMDDYIPLTCGKIIIPDIMDEDVKIELSHRGNRKTQALSKRMFTREELLDTTKFQWRTDFEYYDDEKRLEDTAVIRDEIILGATLKRDSENPSNKDDKLHEGDSVYIYSYYKDNKLGFYFKEYSLTWDVSNFEIEDKAQLRYLKNRGEKSESRRKELALSYSKLYKEKLDYIKEITDIFIQKAVNARLKALSAKKLFLYNQEYEYGEYHDFGLKFTIYNCFNKTIKYVEFTCVPYNAVNDVQPDWVGKRISRTKGIGPLAPGEDASWSWDDMFYDKNNVIRRIVLTNIKFIFNDGTSLNYSGKNEIDKHRISM